MAPARPGAGQQRFFADHGGDVSDVRYAELAAAVGPAFDRAASHARRLAYRDQLNASLELLPGIADWLSQAAPAPESGWRWPPAPRAGGPAGTWAATGRWPRSSSWPAATRSARAKPDPGVYLLALERLGLPADRVVAVEDSPHGVAAAQAAGLRCVAIPNPHADPARFTTADLLLSSAEQLPLEELLRTLEPSPCPTAASPWAARPSSTSRPGTATPDDTTVLHVPSLGLVAATRLSMWSRPCTPRTWWPGTRTRPVTTRRQHRPDPQVPRRRGPAGGPTSPEEFFFGMLKQYPDRVNP